MKSLPPRTQFFALFVLLCASASAASGQGGRPAPQLNWQEFTSEAGEFTAKFPSRPTLKQVPFTKGPLNFVRHVHEATVAGEYTFELDYIDMPAGYNDPELTTEGGITGMTRGMVEKGARVLTNTKVTRGTCEGREATLALPNPSRGGDAFAQGRIFSSGQRYYLLIFVGERDGAAARRVGQTFMDSFTIKGGCSKAVAPTVAPPSAPVKSSVAGTPDAATGWRKIESIGHGFSVLMPGAAELESEQAQVQPLPLWHYTYSHESPSVIYSAEVTGEYPPDFHSGSGGHQAMLDLTFFSLKRNLEPHGFTVTPGRDLKLGTFPGREYRVANAGLKIEGRAQLFVTPKWLYVFIALDHGRTAGSAAEIERFFSSVRISGR